MGTESGLRRRVKRLERGRVPAAVRDRGAVPGGAVPAALGQGLGLPGLAAHGGYAELKGRAVYQCNRCKRQVGLTAGTVFHWTKLPLTTWFLAIYHLTQSKGGMSSVELARRLGTRQPTAWLIKHKLMAAMAAREAEKPKLAGRVEVDDAYLGGQRAGGKRGRGAAGKTPFVAAVETTAERKPRRLRLTVSRAFARRRSRRWPSATSSPAATSSATTFPAGRRSGSWLRPLPHGPVKKLEANEEALLQLLRRWQGEAAGAGRTIARVAVAFEAGRAGFWLARWLRAHGIEAHVIHPTSVAVSREHRRAKTDRLNTGLLRRAFLGWLRGEPDHCSMVAIPTLEEEDAKRPNRERESLIGERTRIITG